MIVSLNFEVIILLGYIYPEWKSKIGKNFVPLILDAFSRQNLDKKTDLQTLELLNHITGVDGKDEIKEDILELCAKKGAIKSLTKSISDNNYDKDYIEKCRPLL